MQFKKGLRLIIRFLLADKKCFYTERLAEKNKCLSKLPNTQLLDTEKKSYSRCLQVYTSDSECKHSANM